MKRDLLLCYAGFLIGLLTGIICTLLWIGGGESPPPCKYDGEARICTYIED